MKTEHIEHSEVFTQCHMPVQTKCTSYLVDGKTEPVDTMSTAVTVRSDPNDLTPTLSNTKCQTPVTQQINEIRETIPFPQKSSQEFDSYLDEIQHDIQMKNLRYTKGSRAQMNNTSDDLSGDWPKVEAVNSKDKHK